MMRQLYYTRKFLIGLLIVSLCFFAAPTAQAVSIYWDGTSASWDTAANWSTVDGATTPDPVAVPGASDDVFFNTSGINGVETVTLGAANQLANSLTFRNTNTTALTGGGTNRTLTLGTGGITVNALAGAVTIGSGTGGQNVAITLAGNQTWANNSSSLLTIANTTSNASGTSRTLTIDGTSNITTAAINAPDSSSAINITKNGTNTLLINTGSDLRKGVITINSGRIEFNADSNWGGLSGSGGVLSVLLNQSKWLWLNQYADSTFSGQINNNGTGRFGLYKRGGGTLTLNGSLASTFANERLDIYGGGVTLDFVNLATPTNLIGNMPLNLGGGRLTIRGKTGGTGVVTSQALGNLSANTDTYSSIVIDPNGGDSTTLTLGTVQTAAIVATGTGQSRRDLFIDLSSTAGGTANITTTSGSAVATTLPYAVVKDTTGTGFASIAAGAAAPRAISRLTAFTALPTLGAGSTSINYSVAANWTKGDALASSVGTLTVDSSSATVAIDLNATALTVSNSGLLTTGANAVTISNGTIGNTTGDLYFHTFAPTTVSTAVGAVTAGVNIIKDGTSTLTYNPATSTITGRLQVRTGTMVIDNTAMSVAAQSTLVGANGIDNATLTLKGTTAYTATGQSMYVGDSGGATGTLNIQDSANIPAIANLYVGGSSDNNSTANGTVNQTSSGTVAVTGGVTIGGRSSTSSLGVGTYNISAGALTAPTVTVANYGTGTLNITGTGSVTYTTGGDATLGGNAGSVGTITIGGTSAALAYNPTGSWFQIGLSGSGTMNIGTGGSFTSGSTVIFNRNGTAVSNVVNQTGGTVTIAAGRQINMANASVAGSTSTYNLDGGTLTVERVYAGSTNGTRIFNFNGGTFRALTGGQDLLNLGAGTGTRVANVRNNGAILDGNGVSVTLSQPLVHSTIFSDNATDGGLNMTGSGTVALTGTNTYNGPTSITGGTLALTGTGAINSSSGITVNGATAKFVQNSSVAVTPTINVVGSTLDGTTTVGAVIVSDNPAATVANGDGGFGTFTLGSLSFSGDATANIRIGQLTPTVPGLAVTGALSTTPANGTVTVNPTTNSGLWTNGIYNLISYGSFGGAIGDFTLGTLGGTLNSRQLAAAPPSLLISGSNIALQINGDTVTWTGLDDANWATGLTGTNRNWKLTTGGTATDYVDGDDVVFNDSVGAGPTAIDLGNYVTPGTMIFNNSAVNYSISSTGGFNISGIGSLTKSGAGSLTINTNNSYTGGNVFTGGTLNVGSVVPLGYGTLRIDTGSAKVLDNTAGFDTIMSGITSQNWNDDFTFTGANSLDMGNGTVTLGGGAGARTLTVSANTLTVGTITSPALSGIGFTKAGTGTLYLNPTVASNIDGTLTVSDGTLNIGSQNFSATGLSGSGTIGNGSAVNRWLYINTASANTFSGILQDTFSVGKLGLSKSGAGSLTLTNANTYIDTTTINSGTLVAANASALGTGNINFPATSTGTLEIALDAPTTLANATFGSSTGSAFTLVSNVATPSNPGVTHTLPGNGLTGGMGGGTITIAAGANVLGGSPAIALGALRMTAGSTQTTTFIPTTAAVSIASVDNASNNTHTLGLAGTGTGSIGNITRTTGTLNVLKSNTSTWTLLGTSSSYNGTTTINAGVLNVGNGGASGDLNAGVVTNNATLNFNRSDTLTVASTIGGTTGTINQVGGGTTILTGTSGFSGATNINAGTLAVNGSLTSSAITVNAGGTLDGTGSVGAVTVADNATASVANGVGAGGDLVIGSLTFLGDAAINVRPSSPGLIVSGALTTTPAFGTVTVNPTPASGLWVDGANDLIGYGAGSAFALGGGDVVLGTLGGALNPRQSNGGLLLRDANIDTIDDTIAIQINGDSPVWSGALSGEWSTATLAEPKNWTLQTALTTTDFMTGDNTIFGDTVGTTTIDISAADVNPSVVRFNNETSSYAIGSTGGFGIANWGAVTTALIKNGAGAVTINTNNTATGSVTTNAGTLELNGTNAFSSATVNGGTLTLGAANAFTGVTLNAGGTLNINDANAIGTGPLTITGGTIGNTSAGAVALATNNVQNWNADFSYAGPQNLDLGTGAVTLSANRIVTVNAGTLTVGGVIAPTARGITVAGTSGTLRLSAANTYTGATSVTGGTLAISGTLANTAIAVSGGTLRLENAGAVSQNTITVSSSGTLATTVAGALSGTAIVRLNNGGTATLTQANSHSGTTTIDGSGSSVLTLNDAASAGSGVIQNWSTNNTINLHINDGGGGVYVSNNYTQYYGNTSTFDVNNNGDSSVNGVIAMSGTFQVGDSGTATVNVTGGNGYRLSLPTVQTGGWHQNTVTFNPTTASVTIGNFLGSTNPDPWVALTLGGTSTGNQITGSITQGTKPLSVNKSNTSTWTLSGGASSYTGATTISGGTLIAGATNTLSSTSAVSITGGTLDASGFANTIPSLSIGASGSLYLGVGNMLSDTGAASLAGSLTVSGTAVDPVIQVMSYASKTGGFATFSLPVGYLPYADTLGLYITKPTDLIFTGAASNGNWDTSTLNFTSDGINSVAFTEFAPPSTPPSAVTFNDTIANGGNNTGQFTIAVVAGGVSPVSTTVTGTTNYTFGGGAIKNGSFTMNGTGAVTLSAANTYGGATNINAGTMNLTGSLTSSAVNVAGASALNLSGSLIGSAVNVAAGGTLSETSTGAISGAGTLTSSGTTTLAGANTYSGGTIVNAGTLTVNAPGLTAINNGVIRVRGASTLSVIDGTVSTPAQVFVGDQASDNATLTINGAGAVFTTTSGTNPSLRAGDVAGSTGTINVTNGTLNANEIWLSHAIGATGTMNINGGTVNASSWVAVGRDGDNGILNVSSGALNVTGNNLTLASFGTNVGQANISGGTVTTANSTYVGEGGTGTLTMSGAGSLVINGVAEGLRVGRNTGSIGTVNLNGGTITAPVVSGGGGASTFNFNGGTLKASATNATFMQALTNSYVKAGGAVIDTNTFNATISQPLLEDPVSTGGGLTKNSLGTLTLTGINTYTGNTTVNGGTLDVLDLNTPTATVTVAAGSNSLIATSITANTLTIGAGATVTIKAIPGGPLSVGGGLTAVPEPSTWAMLLLAAMGLGMYWRRGR